MLCSFGDIGTGRASTSADIDISATNSNADLADIVFLGSQVWNLAVNEWLHFACRWTYNQIDRRVIRLNPAYTHSDHPRVSNLQLST